MQFDALSLFGLFAVALGLLTYQLESRSHWFVLLFVFANAMASAYAFLQGAWPFGLAEGGWAIASFRRWYLRLRDERDETIVRQEIDI